MEAFHVLILTSHCQNTNTLAVHAVARFLISALVGNRSSGLSADPVRGGALNKHRFKIE